MGKISRKTVKASELISSKQKFRLPECQRNLDSEQVNNMLSYQTSYFQKYNEYFLPPPFVVDRFDGRRNEPLVEPLDVDLEVPLDEPLGVIFNLL